MMDRKRKKDDEGQVERPATERGGGKVSAGTVMGRAPKQAAKPSGQVPVPASPGAGADLKQSQQDERR